MDGIRLNAAFGSGGGYGVSKRPPYSDRNPLHVSWAIEVIRIYLRNMSLGEPFIRYPTEEVWTQSRAAGGNWAKRY